MRTCEWRPATNRSVVSIEVAARQVRAEDRAALIAAFNGRQFFDHVIITRDAIQGVFASYGPTIRRMNFGRGKVCDIVTRTGWTDEHQAAIVFRVNDRFYGYAATCGNLFELDGTPNRLPPAAPAVPPAADLPPAEATPAQPPPTQPTGSNPPETFEAGCDCSATPLPGVSGWFVGGPIVVTQPPIAPSIPEPGTWSLMVGGLAALYWLRTRRSRS